jgi:hypothetical protein
MPHYPGHVPFAAKAAEGFPELDGGSIHRASTNPALAKLSNQVAQAYEARPADVAGILAPAALIVRELELTLATAKAILATAHADFPSPEPERREEVQAETPALKSKPKVQAQAKGQGQG